MAVALEQFIKSLTGSGVIAPGKLESFVPPKAHPKDAQELARQLVQSKQLTKFQAQEIYHGRTNSLIMGNYTLLDKIGAGGMGQVFKAQHRRMERHVAIKMLPKAVMKDAAAAARFQREVVVASRLLHPNIVSAFDADEANGVHFLVMEYVEGSDLAALVKKNGPFPVTKGVSYMLQAARGLEFAHGEGVVHRDIKPANLLLDKKGVVKILDMGLARIDSGGDAATQAELTGTGAVMGTVDYMAPEQALSTKHADARADIYSLGCTLHYLLTGKAAYDGDTLMAKLLAHREKPIPSLGPERPTQVQAIFEKMVAKKIEDRYQTMSDVVAALEHCQSNLSTSFGAARSLGTSSGSDRTSFVNDAPTRTTQKPKPAKNAAAAEANASTTPGKYDNRFILKAVGAGILALAILAAVIFLLRSKDGTLTVEINQPDAVVQVLNEEGTVEISQPGGKGTISISVDPGKHRLKVEKDGFKFFARDFAIESGGTPTIKAQLVPRDDKPQVAGKKRLLAFQKPGFDPWVKEVAALPAVKQVEAVAKKLIELNPGFDGKVTDDYGNGPPKIENGMVTEMQFVTDNVTDISPVRALKELQKLRCPGSNSGKGRLSDLSPLRGMKLSRLDCGSTQVADLSPLKETKLTDLNCGTTLVADLRPLSGMPLTSLDCANDAISDFSPLHGMPLTRVFCGNTRMRDLSPLKGLHLTVLVCDTMPLSELSPLRGMPLTELDCHRTQVADLSPLREMPMTILDCAHTAVADLSPLKAMKLSKLACDETQVTDLSPLKGMPLQELTVSTTPVSDLSPLDGLNLVRLCFTPGKITKGIEVVRRMKSLGVIGSSDWPADQQPAAEFWRKYDAGVFGKPEAIVKPIITFNDPAFKKWEQEVAALPAEKQVAAVVKKLQQFNPGYDGEEKHTIETDQVVQLELVGHDLTDLSPVRAMSALRDLRCQGKPDCLLKDLSPLKGLPLTTVSFASSRVSDLSPLRGMKLTGIGVQSCPITDFSPLQGMPLEQIWAWQVQVTDLTPLKGMPLNLLHLASTPVKDLSPLAGMPLISLWCNDSNVTDLKPLHGLPLKQLFCRHDKISDLSPLQGAPLLELDVLGTNVTDLSALKDMPLEKLSCDFVGQRDAKILRSIKTLKVINDKPIAEFWKEAEASKK
jgi:serine/threonine protein kinase/Leucine-rich repeat (LRR) protein